MVRRMPQQRALRDDSQMKLSMTSRATEWLAQFEIDDRVGAIAVLDAVRFVPGGEVVTGIRRALEQYISENEDQLPIALVPVLSDEDVNRPDGSVLDAKATAFVDFDPAQPIANNPGSEALVAQLIGEMRRATVGASILPAPLTLDEMQRSNVRTLVCVTDYIGSGRQVLDYVAIWYRNGTIKSWCSFGWLKIVVVAFAATVAGKRAVEECKQIHRVEVIEIVPGIDELRLAAPDGKAEEVCRVYAKRGKVWPPLGHRGSTGLYASSFSVPNNLPGILIRRTNRWTPFFDGRSVPVELADEIGDYRPDTDLADHLDAVGQSRLAARHRDGHLRTRWEHFVGVLALLPRKDEELALALGLDLGATRSILESLERLLLIDEKRAVTPAGRRELIMQRRKPRRGGPVLTPDPSLYYPRDKR